MESIAQPIQLDFDTPHLCECGCGQPTKISTVTSTREGRERGKPNRFLQYHNSVAQHGDPLKRFEHFQNRGRDTDCWVWSGRRQSGNYGMFKIQGKIVQAHRLAYEFAFGPIPEGMFVCHRCDNHPCVNPSHLFLGTPRDNMSDMVAKGRSLKGSKSVHAKLCENDILEIRRRLSTGELTSIIARSYNVSWTAIKEIGIRKTWKHVA